MSARPQLIINCQEKYLNKI
uniref:Uncharacterized protein n=1 Tax=Rhizophora mucronata TaxID=61149 RepID=A0A2P2QBK6_RHIMU